MSINYFSKFNLALIVGAILLLLGLVGFFWLSNRTTILAKLASPLAQPPKLEIMAWYPDWDEPAAITSLQTANIDSVSPFWYQLNAGGHIDSIMTPATPLAKAEIAQRRFQVVPSVVNDFDPVRVHQLVSDSTKWEASAQYLIDTAKQNNYQGWDLDWEELNPDDRQAYVDYVNFLAGRLHQNQLILSVTVHAQTGDPDPRPAVAAQDMVGLSQNADQIRIMAYDFHYSEGEPGPVTPISELAKVLAFARQNLPIDKVVIGLPTYGYDWSSKPGEEIQYPAAVELLAQHHSSYTFDQSADALHASYQDSDVQHQLWFENAQTLDDKVQMVKMAGFDKIALWRLGGEDPAIWQKLK